MARFVTHGYFIPGILLVLGVSGCGSSELTGDDALERGPLPYDVGIFLDLEGLGYNAPAGGQGSGYVTYLSPAGEILDRVQNAIAVQNPVVSRAQVLAGVRTRDEALRAASDLDLLLAVGFEAPREFDSHDWPWYWGALEITSWLFGGVPSWFVPSARYETTTVLTIGAIDLHQRSVRRWQQSEGVEAPGFDWQDILEAPTQNASLFDRSSFTGEWSDYLLTILVPPILIHPGDPDRLSESLTAGINDQLSEQLAESLKATLLEFEFSKPLSIVFISPDPLNEVLDEAVALELGVGSPDGGRIQSLEVSRLAPEAAPFRWQASAEEVGGLNDALESVEHAGDHVSFFTSEIPLETGANVVKVRAVREDGDRAVRTMVYFH